MDELEARRHEVFQQLANLFGLTYVLGDPNNQTWELQVADPAKIPSFLAKFSSLSAEAQYVLAEILMASFDLSAEDDVFNPADWDLYWSFLSSDIPLFTPILIYWAEVEKTGGWAVGPHLRGKLAQDRIVLPPWPWE